MMEFNVFMPKIPPVGKYRTEKESDNIPDPSEQIKRMSSIHNIDALFNSKKGEGNKQLSLKI